MSMRLSRLELSPASRLRLDVFSESCPSASGRTQINASVRKLIRIQVFYRAEQLAGWMLRRDACWPQKNRPPTRGSLVWRNPPGRRETYMDDGGLLFAVGAGVVFGACA